MGIESTPFEDEPGDEGNIETVAAPPWKSTRKRSITIFIVVSVLNAALLVVLWTQLLTPARNPAQTQANVSSGSSAFSGPLVGQPAPDFTLAELNAHAGPKISLASFKGRPVVLNVWQSSCAPCVSEASTFQATWQRVRSQGIVFLGMDFQDMQGDALNFVKTHGITYTNVVDQDGSTAINYGVTGTPETIFIDRRGVIVGRHSGEMSAQMLQAGLQLLSR